jgi:broad specificity phosphatase PhoE
MSATTLSDLVLVRHGESEGNVVSKNPEISTEPFEHEASYHYRLTDKGIRQAQCAGKWIKANIGDKFDRYICSDYMRTRETALHLGLSDAKWILKTDVREAHFEGSLPVLDEEKKDQTSLITIDRERKRSHRFEKFLNAMTHVDLFLQQFVYGNPHGVSRILLVCHANVIRFVKMRLESLTQERVVSSDLIVYNGSVLWYSTRGPSTSIRPHLSIEPSIQPFGWLCVFNNEHDQHEGEVRWNWIGKPLLSNHDLLQTILQTTPRLI